MAEILQLSIFTPERKLLASAEIAWVKVPSAEGEIEVLPTHENMIGLLETGILSYAGADQVLHEAVISSGTFQIEQNHVKVLAETLELPREIDSDRAKRAQNKAEEILNQAAFDPSDFKKYQLKLQRSLLRQQAVQRSGR